MRLTTGAVYVHVVALVKLQTASGSQVDASQVANCHVSAMCLLLVLNLEACLSAAQNHHHGDMLHT